MSDKEKKFVSAVVYLHNDGDRAVSFFRNLNEKLAAYFEHYELIAVDNACCDSTIPMLREWAACLSEPFTIVHMSLKQSQEACMNAGLHASIGDYVYEFDSTAMPYPNDLILKAYEKTQQGCDIVGVCPGRSAGVGSWLFYKIFNTTSLAAYPLRSESFRIVTRRAINRVHATSEHLPYRKAAYAASGLKMSYLEWSGSMPEVTTNRVMLAINSLALYTNAAYRFSVGITFAMVLLTLMGMAYAVYVFCSGQPVEGWTTTMLVVTFCFTGLFVVAAIIIKYLALILELVFHKQHYLIEGIEKLPK